MRRGRRAASTRDRFFGQLGIGIMRRKFNASLLRPPTRPSVRPNPALWPGDGGRSRARRGAGRRPHPTPRRPDGGGRADQWCRLRQNAGLDPACRRFFSAAKRTGGTVPLELAAAGQFVRRDACGLPRAEPQLLGDAVVTNRVRGQPLDQFADIVAHCSWDAGEAVPPSSMPARQRRRGQVRGPRSGARISGTRTVNGWFGARRLWLAGLRHAPG